MTFFWPFLLAYFIFYFLVLLHLIFFWLLRKPNTDKISNNIKPKVSVLIAVRNEEKNILECLESLERQNYPRENVEILIGNDQSEDNTKAIIEKFIRDKANYKLLDIKLNVGQARGKANVLAQLADLSTAELFFITDADITVPANWIENMLLAYTGNTGIVSGTTIVKGARIFDRFQAIDMAFGHGMIQLVSDFGIPVTAIGNNMMVVRKAYLSTGGYGNMPFSVTEDFQLFKAVLKEKWGFRNLLDKDMNENNS